MYNLWYNVLDNEVTDKVQCIGGPEVYDSEITAFSCKIPAHEILYLPNSQHAINPLLTLTGIGRMEGSKPRWIKVCIVLMSLTGSDLCSNPRHFSRPIRGNPNMFTAPWSNPTEWNQCYRGQAQKSQASLWGDSCSKQHVIYCCGSQSRRFLHSILF